jgi:predicted transposase YdaD
MRYDSVLKRLLDGDPTAWTKLLDLEGIGPLTLVDTEFHTTSARVDKLIHVEAPQKWLIHIEFQMAYEKAIGLRIVRYSAMIEYELKLPVMSVLVLLTPEADGAECQGTIRRYLPNHEICYDEFRFKVIRVWQQPVEFFLKGGLGTLPLALISAVTFEDLPQVINEVKRRVDVEILVEADRTEFWATAEILLGAIYEKVVVELLLKGIANMRESSVVIGYLEEGRQEGRQEGAQHLRHLLLGLGIRYLGEPDDAVRRRIESISDLNLLERLTASVVDATSWNELFPKE